MRVGLYPRCASVVMVVAALFGVACTGGDNGVAAGGSGSTAVSGSGGALASGGSSGTSASGQAGQISGGGGLGNLGGAGSGNAAGLTYWGDVAPIIAENCLPCHQAGGIGPEILSDYAMVSGLAASIADAVSTRTMPPWSALDDGSCGSFIDSLTLTDVEIEVISAWAMGDKLEGTPTEITVPAPSTLTDGVEYTTPEFAPMPEGSVLAMNDEYRCFLLEPNLTQTRHITAYEVVPGNAAMIHHVIVMLVDPAAASGVGAFSNAEQIAALDTASPDRLGWPCFGMAGEGVNVKGVPVTWAPGQGVVAYPGNSGVPVGTGDKFVVQVHYNLEDPTLIGQTDVTTVRFRMADTVERLGVFVLHDPLLASLSSLPPDVLAAGQESVPYDWQATLADFELTGLQNVQLHGVMPHMHKLGSSYSLRVVDGQNDQCGIEVPRWDIHWQRTYFYQTPFDVTNTTQFGVSCDFDTSSATSPVMPGWGTSNEMCLAVLYFTADAP